MIEERRLMVTFTIPFGGGPGDVAARMLRASLMPLLNSLPEIHPDITARISEDHMVDGWPPVRSPRPIRRTER